MLPPDFSHGLVAPTHSDEMWLHDALPLFPVRRVRVSFEANRYGTVVELNIEMMHVGCDVADVVFPVALPWAAAVFGCSANLNGIKVEAGIMAARDAMGAVDAAVLKGNAGVWMGGMGLGRHAVLLRNVAPFSYVEVSLRYVEGCYGIGDWRIVRLPICSWGFDPAQSARIGNYPIPKQVESLLASSQVPAYHPYLPSTLIEGLLRGQDVLAEEVISESHQLMVRRMEGVVELRAIGIRDIAGHLFHLRWPLVHSAEKLGRVMLSRHSGNQYAWVQMPWISAVRRHSQPFKLHGVFLDARLVQSERIPRVVSRALEILGSHYQTSRKEMEVLELGLKACAESGADVAQWNSIRPPWLHFLWCGKAHGVRLLPGMQQAAELDRDAWSQAGSTSEREWLWITEGKWNDFQAAMAFLTDLQQSRMHVLGVGRLREEFELRELVSRWGGSFCNLHPTTEVDVMILEWWRHVERTVNVELEAGGGWASPQQLRICGGGWDPWMLRADESESPPQLYLPDQRGGRSAVAADFLKVRNSMFSRLWAHARLRRMELRGVARNRKRAEVSLESGVMARNTAWVGWHSRSETGRGEARQCLAQPWVDFGG